MNRKIYESLKGSKIARLLIIFFLIIVLSLLVYTIINKFFSDKWVEGLKSIEIYIETTETKSLTDIKNLKNLEFNPSALRLYNHAKSLGYEHTGETVQFANKDGFQTTVTSLFNDNDEIIFLTQKSGIGQGREYLTQIDRNENTLTTFNDSESGLKTDLATGEVLDSWGPITHHSDEYDYNLDECLNNFMIWSLGLEGSQAYQLFQIACANLISMDELLQSTIDYFKDPVGAVAESITCVNYLSGIRNSADSLIETGDIVGYLPDLSLAQANQNTGSSVVYTPGRLSVEVYNKGRGYSGPFDVAFFSKMENQPWQYIDRVEYENIRPKNSNDSFPFLEEFYADLNYTTQEGEIISVKIDPRDLVEEKNEDNNTVIVGREILNQAPSIGNISISTDYPEAGENIFLHVDAIDPDGHLALRAFEWDFGDGTVWRADDTILYSFATSGERLVKVRAIDSEGAKSDWVELQIIIHDPADKSIVDKRNMTVISAFDAPADFVAITWDGRYLWAAGSKLYKIKPANGEIVETITPPAEIEIQTPGMIEMVWKDNSLWVLNAEHKKVYQLNTDGSLKNSYDVPSSKPTDIVSAENNIYIVNDFQSLSPLLQQRESLSISELPEIYYSVGWDGSNFWGSTGSNIHKLNDQFQIINDFPSKYNDRDEWKYNYLTYGIKDIIFEKDAIWVLANNIIYKCLSGGLETSYIEIPSDYSYLRGIPWDADGFVAGASRNVSGDINDYIFKISDLGEIMFKIDDPIDVEDIAFDGTSMWGLDSGRGIFKFSSDGEVLDVLGINIEDIYTLSWSGANWWVGGRNKIYKLDESGSIVKTVEVPLNDINDMLWIENYLWATDASKRIFKLQISGTQAEIEENYSFGIEKSTDAGWLGWDGKNLWRSSGRKIHQLTYIQNNETDVNKEPIFNGAKPIVVDVTPVVPIEKPDSRTSNEPSCISYMAEYKDSSSKYQNIRSAYPVSENEIYFFHQTGVGVSTSHIRKFDGSRITDLGEEIHAKYGWINGFDSNHLIVSYDTISGLYELKNQSDLINITDQIDASFIPARIETLSDKTAYVLGFFSHCPEKFSTCPAMAFYDGNKWTLKYKTEDEDYKFHSFKMFSHNLGYAVTTDNLYKYNGTDWNIAGNECAPENISPSGISFISPNHGYIGYWSGEVKKYDGLECIDLPKLPDSRTINDIYAKSTDEIYTISAGINNFYRYDGSEWKQIRLTELIQNTTNKEFKAIGQIIPISENKVLLLGAEATFVICENLANYK